MSRIARTQAAAAAAVIPFLGASRGSAPSPHSASCRASSRLRGGKTRSSHSRRTVSLTAGGSAPLWPQRIAMICRARRHRGRFSSSARRSSASVSSSRYRSSPSAAVRTGRSGSAVASALSITSVVEISPLKINAAR